MSVRVATVWPVDALEMLAEQLWLPGVQDDVRLLTDPAPEALRDPGWVTREQYEVIGGLRRPRLMLPVGPARVRHAALTQYRGLRPRTANAVRALLGAASSTGVPLARTRLAVQVRAGSAAELPLDALARELGSGPLHATFGVRTGANRKATLQLLSSDGTPLGYAKLGWRQTADEYVRCEAAALAAVGGREASMRAPALLASLEQGGRPVVVVAPLPTTVRGVRGDVAAPSARELFALAPVARVERPSSTAHLTALAQRLDDLRGAEHPPAVAALLSGATALLRRILDDEREIPVQARWHGDLTPWNCAREPGGQLWAWDWESSETDVVAGLDAVHWHFSVLRESGRLASLSLAECLVAARPHLHAAGTPTSAHGLVGAVYLLTVVERAATLARREGGWERVWITPQRLAELTAEAAAALT